MRRHRLLQENYQELEKKYMSAQAERLEMAYQLRIQQEKLELAERQDVEIHELHQCARQLKHDMKNHLMVIASYLNAQDVESAKTYSSAILGKLNKMHSYVETGNLLMNHILNEKLSYAREKGISIKAEIENLTFSKLKHIDFSAMLSNLLDNAIEANLGLVSPEMVITIVKCKGYETICIKNKVHESVLLSNPELKSTKANPGVHGIGLLQVKEIVNANNGLIDFYEEGHFFCVGIFIPE